MNSTIAFLKAISDKNRLLILRLLKEHTLCVCDIQTVIPLTQGALSIQLKSLTAIRLLKPMKQGKWVFYKFSNELSSMQSQIISEIFKDIESDKEVIAMLNKVNITEICKDC